MTWHVDEMSAKRYVARRLDGTSAASIESHALVCDECRTRLGQQVDDVLLDSVWLALTEALDRPDASPIERALQRIGCSDVTARVVAATSRQRWPFVLAVAISLSMSLVAIQSSYEDFFGLFLIIAPLGPLVATASSFGRWSDPAYEITVMAPTPALRILLIRIAASVVPAIALTALSVPWLLDRGWFAIAWLLPSLALSAGALALSSWVDVERAALGLGLMWLALPTMLRLPVARLIDLFGAPVQVVSAVVAATAVVVVATRHESFDIGGL